MSELQSQSSDVTENKDTNADVEDPVKVDKRTFWFMVAVVAACMSILAICVALVLWKKFLRRNVDTAQYQEECMNSGKTNFSNNLGEGEYQQQMQDGEREMIQNRDTGSARNYGARPKGSTGSNAGYGQRNTQQHASSNQYINSEGPNNILDSYNQEINDLNEEEDNQPPCLNCSLIQQGSAISYGDNSCPQCGRDVGM